MEVGGEGVKIAEIAVIADIARDLKTKSSPPRRGGKAGSEYGGGVCVTEITGSDTGRSALCHEIAQIARDRKDKSSPRRR